MSTSSNTVEVSVEEVLIELDDNMKSKLVNDLSSICEVTETAARSMLEIHKWDIQAAIDMFLDDDNDSDDVSILPSHPNPKGPTEEITLDDSVEDIGASVTSFPVNQPLDSTGSVESGTFSTWAPEKFSILSWNLDGLDDKSLKKRTCAVIDLIEKENHDILFFQELLPLTFDYIAKKLSSKYTPVIGTKNPNCDYFTATFLRLNKVFYEDHYIIPFPNSVMQRNLLVTKAFIGQAKLFLLNTHLESTTQFEKQRSAQLKICFDHCTSFPSEYNVIFGGDLNLRDKEVEGLLPQVLSDLWVKCGSRETCRYTWDLTRNTNKQMPSKFQPRCRFDRFYFRNSLPLMLTPEFFGVTGIEKVEGTQSFPSDHWAIISFFRLTQEARQPRKPDSIKS